MRGSRERAGLSGVGHLATAPREATLWWEVLRDPPPGRKARVGACFTHFGSTSHLDVAWVHGKHNGAVLQARVKGAGLLVHGSPVIIEGLHASLRHVKCLGDLDGPPELDRRAVVRLGFHKLGPLAGNVAELFLEGRSLGRSRSFRGIHGARLGGSRCCFLRGSGGGGGWGGGRNWGRWLFFLGLDFLLVPLAVIGLVNVLDNVGHLRHFFLHIVSSCRCDGVANADYSQKSRSPKEQRSGLGHAANRATWE